MSGDGKTSASVGVGTAGYSSDGGPAILAEVNTPVAVALAGDQALYIADQGNNRVRKVAGRP